jgi:hypothetical protein
MTSEVEDLVPPFRTYLMKLLRLHNLQLADSAVSTLNDVEKHNIESTTERRNDLSSNPKEFPDGIILFVFFSDCSDASENDTGVGGQGATSNIQKSSKT